MSIELSTNSGAPMPIGLAVETFARLADQIAATEFVPQSMRNKPAAVLACMMYGAELGLGPMQSLNSIQSIQGSVGLKPEGMRAMVTQLGHRIWPEDYSTDKVTLCGWRKGDPADAVVKVTWTTADARQAGLEGGANWKKYPRAMLLARATSELCRLHFADVIGGLSYTPDEIESFDPPFVGRPTLVSDDPFPESGSTSAPPPPVAIGPAPTADAETGEMVPAPTTRRAAPVPAGMVSSASAKRQIIAAYEAQGVEPADAVACAHELCSAHMIGTAPVAADRLAVILDFVANPHKDTGVPVNADTEPDQQEAF